MTEYEKGWNAAIEAAAAIAESVRICAFGEPEMYPSEIAEEIRELKK
jgi:hypothetical protein